MRQLPYPGRQCWSRQ